MEQAERELIMDAQHDLAAAKAALNDVSRAMRKLAKLNLDAGRIEASNAAMRLEGAAQRLCGALKEAHADASDSLTRLFSEGGEIVIQGPGR